MYICGVYVHFVVCVHYGTSMMMCERILYSSATHAYRRACVPSLEKDCQDTPAISWFPGLLHASGCCSAREIVSLLLSSELPVIEFLFIMSSRAKKCAADDAGVKPVEGISIGKDWCSHNESLDLKQQESKLTPKREKRDLYSADFAVSGSRQGEKYRWKVTVPRAYTDDVWKIFPEAWHVGWNTVWTRIFVYRAAEGTRTRSQRKNSKGDKSGEREKTSRREPHTSWQLTTEGYRES